MKKSPINPKLKEKNDNIKVKRGITEWKVGHLSFVILVIILLVAGVVLGEVLINYTYSVSTSSVKPKIYFEDGPYYTYAHNMGLITATMSGNPANISSSTTITINTVAGSGETYLLNVLEIYNGTSGMKGIVYIYINGTLPSIVTMYYSSTLSTLGSGTPPVPTGTQWVSGSKIHLSGSALYISFVISGTSIPTSETGTLYVQYTIS